MRELESDLHEEISRERGGRCDEVDKVFVRYLQCQRLRVALFRRPDALNNGLVNL